MAKKQILGFKQALKLKQATTNIPSGPDQAMILPHDANPKPDGIFGNDRLQLKRLSCSFLDLSVLESSRLASHLCST
jgi:hypothetical protein